MDGTEPSPPRRIKRLKTPLLFCFWLALIFGTSCTVVRPHEFFTLVSTITGAGQDSMERFMWFWGLSWFAVVKGWHVTEFAILTVLCASVLKRFFGRMTPGLIVGAMVFCLAFAASDEWHQSFVPDRYGTVQDVLIDSLGVFTAGLMLLVRLHRKTPHSDLEVPVTASGQQ